VNFKLADSIYHSYVNYKTRMPLNYSKAVLKFFYECRFDESIRDSGLLDSLPVSFLAPYTSRGKAVLFGTSFSDDSMDDLVLKSAPKFGYWITPYLGQLGRLRSKFVKFSKKIITMAPVQGLEADEVIFDFTTITPTAFVNNNNAHTAMTRFKKHLFFPTNFKVRVDWFKTKYVFDPGKSIWSNFQIFTRAASGSYFDSHRKTDDNGNHLLKWVFWVGLIEYAQFATRPPPYDITLSIFNQMALIKQSNFQVPKEFFNAVVKLVPSDSYFNQLRYVYSTYNVTPPSIYQVANKLAFSCSVTGVFVEGPSKSFLIASIMSQFNGLASGN